jgi:hypothetical protein
LIETAQVRPISPNLAGYGIRTSGGTTCVYFSKFFTDIGAHQIRVPILPDEEIAGDYLTCAPCRDAETSSSLTNVYEKTVRGYSSTCHFIFRVS